MQVVTNTVVVYTVQKMTLCIVQNAIKRNSLKTNIFYITEKIRNLPEYVAKLLNLLSLSVQGKCIMKRFEMLDLFLIAMLMVGVFFGFAMLSLHGVGYMTWLAWTFFGCSAWCLVVGWCIVAWNMREE